MSEHARLSAWCRRGPLTLRTAGNGLRAAGFAVLKEARQERIRDLVSELGEITVAELNTTLAVSEATIRRDLDEMAELGWVRRTHGGAVRVERADREPPLALRDATLPAEKARIGRVAASMVRPGDRIFLGSGTTVATMPRHLRDVGGLTVVTNSLPVVVELADRDDVELIVIGGRFRHTEQSMISQVAERMIAEFRVDTVFMGIRGLDPAHGFTSDSIDEAAADRAIIQIAPRRVVLADHTKFGIVSTVALAPLAVAAAIVTDRSPQPPIADEIAAAGVDLMVAP